MIKKFIAVLFAASCLTFSACSVKDGITSQPQDVTVPVVSEDIDLTVTEPEQTVLEPSETVHETVPTISEESDVQTDISDEPVVDTYIPDDNEDVTEKPRRYAMFGETADLSFVDITELGEIEWAEIQMFEWHETGNSLGIAEVRSAEDVALLNEIFGSLSLEKTDYMEPSPEVFRMYLYASDGTAARIFITPEPYPNINDYRIVGGKLDVEALTDIFERNK